MKNFPGAVNGTAAAGLTSFTAFCVAVAVSVALGVCALAIATHWGIGIYPDSIVYIGTARSLLNGDGVRFLNDIGEIAPVTQYPPLYPLMIAALGVLGIDPLDGARWISVLFYAGNALLAVYFVYRVTASYVASWLACFLSLSAFPMIYIHSQALTEPVFNFFILLGVLWLVEFLEGSRARALYSASLTIGLSCLVRYVGIAFLLTGGAVILCLSASRWAHRLSAAAKFVVLGSLPLAAWVLRNFFTAGNAVNRTFGIHPPGLSDLLPALDTAGYWLLPIAIVENSPWLARSIVGVLFVSVSWLAVRKKYFASRYLQVLFFCLMGYGLFLLVSMSLNDQPLYFDTRTLALPYVAAMIVTLSVMTDWLRAARPEQRTARWFAFDQLIIVFLAVQTINGVAWLRQSYVDGIGFATEPWRASELIGFVKNSRPPLLIFSNAPDFIATLTGRPAALIPQKVNPNNHRPNDRYGTEIDAMREQLKESNAVVLYFNDENRLWYLPAARELEARVPLEVIKRASDGKIYRLKSDPTSAKP
ncbi:MAG: ArnT family glycosyltransferase [Chloroflexota bacterium]